MMERIGAKTGVYCKEMKREMGCKVRMKTMK